MKYSLLDTFLIWLGPFGLLLMLFVGAFLFVVIGRSCACWLCDRKEKQIRLIDSERSKETCRRMMTKYDEVFRRLAEVERKELIHSRCLANSTRTRYSRSTIRKTKV